MTANESVGDAALLTPENFWSLYKDEIKKSGSWTAYQKEPSWTPIAKSAAKSVCKKFGFQVNPTWLTLGACGWSGTRYDWDLRVAFEAENAATTWEHELCKLAHVVCDLRVLVVYQSNRTR